MKKFTISSKEVILFLVFWLFYPPGYFSTALGMAGILNTLKYLVSLGLLSLALINAIRKKTKPSTISILIVLFYLQLLFVTILNKGNTFECFRYILPPIGVALYYEYCNLRKRVNLIHALFWIHFIFMIINLLTVIVFKNGMYTTGSITHEKFYFMGHNNVAARFLLPGVFYAIMYDCLDSKKLGWKSYLMALLSFVTVTLTWSNTGMVGLGITLLFVILIPRLDMPRIFTAKNALILATVLFVIVVINNNVGIFSFVIEGIFHKQLTLTGRTYLWNAIMTAIARHPLIGYGYGVSMKDMYTTTGRYVASSAHNYFLDLLLRGGVCQLVLQILIVLCTCRVVDRSHGKIRQLMVAVLLSYFIMWQFEPFVNTGYIDMLLVFMMMTTMISIITDDKQRETDSIKPIRS